jgi:dihydrofolate synthase/folylpolyglutamate synthase
LRRLQSGPVNRDDPLARLLALEQFGIKLGLRNIRTLLAALDAPERASPSLHIAGTNGKGSVSAMVERGLRAGGYRTGRYTSPHLDRLEERIAIDGKPAESASLVRAARDVFDAVDRLRRNGTLETTPTFFEVTTAMAFEMFRRAQVDVAVVEVGLGGRFDATNVITPIVAAITSIGLDHERHLGHSLASIAREKAGILKPGVPAVIGELPDEARRVIDSVAREVSVPLATADRSLVTEETFERGRATLSISTPVDAYSAVTLALNGRHQVANALVAIRVMELARGSGVEVGHDAIVTGLRDVSWPARLEWLRFAENKLLIDAAHNPDGARALADYLATAGYPPLPVVLAIMKDKDIAGIVQALMPHASRFVATTVENRRALPARELADRIRSLAGHAPVDAIDDPEAALRHAFVDAGEAIVAGSIFLVGPLRARLIASGAVSWRD